MPYEYEGFVRYEWNGEMYQDQQEGWYWHPTPRESFGPFECEEDAEFFAASLSECE
jgi:hypothetical protein